MQGVEWLGCGCTAVGSGFSLDSLWLVVPPVSKQESLKHKIDDGRWCNLLWIGCQERAADLNKKSWLAQSVSNYSSQRINDVLCIAPLVTTILQYYTFWQSRHQLCRQTSVMAGRHQPQRFTDEQINKSLKFLAAVGPCAWTAPSPPLE